MRKLKKLTVWMSVTAFFACCMPMNFNTAVAAEQDDAFRQGLIEAMDTDCGDQAKQRLVILTEAYIEEGFGSSLSIDRIKTLRDFDGNAFILFELLPTGYLIYHENSGKYVECASESSSPYLNVQGELYYGGMMAYYYRDGDLLRHTLTEETVAASETGAFAEASRKTDAALVQTAETTNLAYLEGETNTVPAVFSQGNAYTSASAQSSVTPRISMESFFENLDTDDKLGGRYGKICGYISSNLIIGYNYFAYDYGLISDPSYVDMENKTMNGPKLTNKLLEIAGKNSLAANPGGTGASDAYGYVGDYLNTVNNLRAWSYGWRLFDWEAHATIDAGHPAAIYGNLVDVENPNEKINHAVVAYDYNEKRQLIVHYGWPNYTRVLIDSGLIGTTFFMKLS